MECNICKGTAFRAYNGREDAMCRTCGSLERSRGLFYLLQTRGLIFPGAKVAHFAPETALTHKIRDVVGKENYEAYDLFPEIYAPEIGTKKFDLIEDVKALPSKKYDLILHAHVLEHLPSWLAPILFHLQRSLKDEGYHLFCIPVAPGKSATDFGSLPEEERVRKFHQKDHVRNFGADDVHNLFGSVFNLRAENSNIRLESEMAAKHGIKVGEVFKSFFLFRRDDWLLSL